MIPKELTIRAAQEADASLILQFIKELAEYEKLSHEVTANEKILSKNLFGEEAYAKVIIAELEGLAVGFALYFHNFSTFLAKPGIYLEDLYVKPAYRGKGIGTQLLKKLAQIAVEKDCGRLEWSVLNWNKDAIRVYEKLGAKAMDEWTTYRLTGDSLEKLAKK